MTLSEKKQRIYAGDLTCNLPGPANTEMEEERLKNMLKILRIKASVIVKPEGIEIRTKDSLYFRSMREMIMGECAQVALVFLYMPPIPNKISDYRGFLDSLSQLTYSLPPILIVRGISPVMSTTI